MAVAHVIISGTYQLMDQDYEAEIPEWQVEEDRKALAAHDVGIDDVLEWCRANGGLEVSIHYEGE